MKRCEQERGLTSVKYCVLSEWNGLWSYFEKSEEAILKEVLKEDFIMEKRGKERVSLNEWNQLKEKTFHRRFSKSSADFEEIVSGQWLRLGYVKKHRSNYFAYSGSGTENELDESKHRLC